MVIRISSPAMIEEATTVVFLGLKVTVTKPGNYFVELQLPVSHVKEGMPTPSNGR